MTRLKDIENDDELAGGLIERVVVEQCRAICKDCKKYVSEWTEYDKALTAFINHRTEVHRKERAIART